MKIILCLLALVFCKYSFAQDTTNKSAALTRLLSGRVGCPPNLSIKKEVPIRVGHCFSMRKNVKPLFVIDGDIKNEFDLKEIDPNNIKSIEILKDATAVTLYGHKAAHGVVIITTKAANQRVIRIIDAATGGNISIATVELAYQENKKDTMLYLRADSLGYFVTNKIISDKEYELTVSSVGYKTFKAFVNSKTIGKSYSVALERNYSKLNEVVIVSYHTTRCRCPICRVSRITYTPVKEISADQVEFKLYPNPVVRSQKVNIEFNSEVDDKLTMKLFGVDGKLISLNEYKVSKGINRLNYSVDPKLSSGLYIVQIIDEKNNLIKSEKLIIQ